MDQKNFTGKECPNGFDYNDLPSTTAPAWGTNAIVYNEKKTKFAFLYDIDEIKMGWLVGKLIFGSVSDGQHTLATTNTNHEIKISVNANKEPNILWLDDESFIYRGYIYHGDTQQLFVPACGIHFEKGLFILPNTNRSPYPLEKIQVSGMSFVSEMTRKAFVDHLLLMQKQGDMPEYEHLID